MAIKFSFRCSAEAEIVDTFPRFRSHAHFGFHDITLHYTTLHYTTLHYTTLRYIAAHWTRLHYIALHYTTLHYITLHYTTLHYTALHCILLHTKHHTLHQTAVSLHIIPQKGVSESPITPHCQTSTTHSLLFVSGI